MLVAIGVARRQNLWRSASVQAKIATGSQGSSLEPLRDSIITVSSSSGMIRDVRVVDKMGIYLPQRTQSIKR
jgi:hypothetical protein